MTPPIGGMSPGMARLGDAYRGTGGVSTAGAGSRISYGYLACLSMALSLKSWSLRQAHPVHSVLPRIILLEVCVGVQRPLEFEADGKTPMAICMCGLSENAPQCDGSHRDY